MTNPDRVVRVFISSTFRDMQRERELLVKQVFPELRRICAQRFVTFTEIDLRWGITEEQAAEGKVLPICLDEIHLSRPYFIGLLGERYGWIPQSVPPSVLAKEPWLQEHVCNRTSVTELEILHGVLNNPEMAGHAYLYFRDPQYAGSLPDTERWEMTEHDIPDDVRAFGEAEAARRTEERKAKLATLKQRIRQSGLSVIEDYPNPEALATAVRENFIRLIDQLYPEEDIPNPLDQETLGHDSYAARKLFAFVPRLAQTAALVAFVSSSSTDQGLVVTGDSGSGKTTLLADWVQSWRATHPNDFVFAHYFGATPDSASAPRFLHRLLAELKRRFGIQDQIPSQPDKLREALQLWLAQTTGRGRVVLVLDALNQIEGDEADRRLIWLPRHFPPHVRVLASALSGPALETMRKSGWAEHKLPLPDAAELRQMIARFFQHYRKEPGEELRGQLANAPGSANPLFLRTVLEEIRQFGSFEKLPAKVAEYLTATTPEDLFRLVLQRWRQDFDAGCDLVRRALGQLWAARQGLSETEWRELLGTPSVPLVRQVWSPLFLAMEPHLALRCGLHTFGHAFLRSAVESEFFSADADVQDAATAAAARVREAHAALAQYFCHGPISRRLDEFPYQLKHSGQTQELSNALCDEDLFPYAMEQGRVYEWIEYWQMLKGNFDPDRCYESSIEAKWRQEGESQSIARLLEHASRLFELMGLYSPALKYRERGFAILEKTLGRDDPELAIPMDNLASMYLLVGRFKEAEELNKTAQRLRRAISAPSDPDSATYLNNQAILLKEQGHALEAIPIAEKALKITETAKGEDSQEVALILANLSTLYGDVGDFEKAIRLNIRSLEVEENAKGGDHPDIGAGLNNLAALYRDTGNYEAALSTFERALGILRNAFGLSHPMVATIYGNIGLCHQSMDDHQKALHCLQLALDLREKALGEMHPSVAYTLFSMSASLALLSRWEDAERCCKRAVAIAKEVHGLHHATTALYEERLEAILGNVGG